MDDNNNIINDSNNAINNSTEDCNNSFIDSQCIEETRNNLVNLNIIKDELAKIPLNPETLQFYNNCVIPLLKTLESLSYASYNFSTAAKNFASINSVSNSKVKDAVELVDDINKVSQEVLESLEVKVDLLLKYAKCCK